MRFLRFSIIIFFIFFCIIYYFPDLYSVPYFKALMLILFPFGFCYLLLCFWIAYALYKKTQWLIILEYFFVTSFITLFYFQPQVINGLAGILNCSQIDNDSYMTDYPFEKCNNNERYSYWRKTMVLPAALFFIIILPSGPFFYMYRNRDRIFSKDVMIKIGFLLNGYSPKRFYW